MATLWIDADTPPVVVWIQGLDTSYSYSGRKCLITVYDTSGDYDRLVYESDTLSIPARTPMFEHVIYSGLVRRTNYHLYADIWDIEGLPDGVHLDEAFRTGTWSPSVFHWSVPKDEDGTLVVTAVEWNAFCARINEWETYKSIQPRTPFTTVSAGGLTRGTVISSSMITAQEQAYPNSVIKASIINEAIQAINEMLPEGEPHIPVQTSGGVITASLFNEMVTKLNGLS